MTVTSQRLWAPWRIGYISQTRNSSRIRCIFCQLQKSRKNAKDQVVVRGRLGFVVLNRFPYNNGHLMIVPYRHVGRMESITQQEWLELFALTKEALNRLRRALKPHGFNLGINLGRVAGAGIPGHFHLHVVPRWAGDTNFMPTIAETKVISQSLASARRLLQRPGERDASSRRR